MLDIQNLIGKSNTEADRKRAYRARIEREKALLLEGQNAEKTALLTDGGQMSGQMSGQCPLEIDIDIEIDKDIEKDKEKEKKKNTKKKKAAPYVADDDLNQAILEFIEFRKQLKKPMTERAIQLMIAKLNKLSTNVQEQIEIVNQSILNGWQGIFPLSNNNQSNRKPIREEVKPSWMKFQQNDYDFEALENDLQGIPANSPPDPDFEKRKAALESRLKEKYGKNKAAGI